MGARPLCAASAKDPEVRRDFVHLNMVDRCISNLLNHRKTVPSLDLAALAKNGLLQAGDVLAYKRSFNGLDTIVEKDLLVRLKTLLRGRRLTRSSTIV